jgi:hypothetical protein
VLQYTSFLGNPFTNIRYLAKYLRNFLAVHSIGEERRWKMCG